MAWDDSEYFSGTKHLKTMTKPGCGAVMALAYGDRPAIGVGRSTVPKSLLEIRSILSHML